MSDTERKARRYLEATEGILRSFSYALQLARYRVANLGRGTHFHSHLQKEESRVVDWLESETQFEALGVGRSRVVVAEPESEYVVKVSRYANLEDFTAYGANQNKWEYETWESGDTKGLCPTLHATQDFCLLVAQRGTPLEDAVLSKDVAISAVEAKVADNPRVSRDEISAENIVQAKGEWLLADYGSPSPGSFAGSMPPTAPALLAELDESE